MGYYSTRLKFLKPFFLTWLLYIQLRNESTYFVADMKVFHQEVKIYTAYNRHTFKFMSGVYILVLSGKGGTTGVWGRSPQRKN